MAINRNAYLNTPQANNDQYHLSVSDLFASPGLFNTSTNIITLDVMANDLGGGAKALYSLADARGNAIDTSALLKADALNGGASAWERTDAGNDIRINNGKIEYRINNLDALGTGTGLHDVFTYAIRLANGTLSYATVTLDLDGSNDGVAITSAPQAGTVTEDAAQQALGQISFSDPDLGDVHRASFTPAAGNGTALGRFALAPVSETGSGGSVGWTYTLDNGAAQHLAAGARVSESFVVTVTDAAGAKASQQVTVTIVGTNDAPMVAAAVTGAVGEGSVSANVDALAQARDADDGAVLTVVLPAELPAGVSYDAAAHAFRLDARDAAYQHLAAGRSTEVAVHYAVSDGLASSDASAVFTVTGTNDGPVAAAANLAVAEDAAVAGAVAATDADDGESATLVYALKSAAPAGLDFHDDGSFSFDASSYDFLAQGEELVLAVPYTATDAQGAAATADLSITVTGAQDAAAIAASAQEDVAVTEAGTSAGDATAGGKLTVSDADRGEAGFQLPASLAGSYGNFAFDAATGTWSYALNNGAAQVQALTAGQVVSDSLTVVSLDGSASHTVTVNVTGANDAPVFGGQTAGTVTEDTVTSVSGALTIADPDAGQSLFQAATGLAGAYGTLNINAQGEWTYFLNNSLAAVQALNGGQSLQDSISVKAADGTLQPVTIAINGINEPAYCTVDFEDKADRGYSLNDGYRGFNWSTGNGAFLSTTNGDNTTYYTGTGYIVAAAGPGSIVAYTPWGYEPVSITRTDGGDFKFHGVELTAAWENMHVTVSGFNNGVLVGSTNLALTTTAISPLSVSWGYIDNLVIDVLDGEAKRHIILDDFQYSLPSGDPIVLDLDGNGVQFGAGGRSVNFDLNADGSAETLAAVSPGDGVLVMDLDASGAIENGLEVLSDHFQDFGFGNAMEALRSLDANVDGVVDAADPLFAGLLAWRDANGDGVSQKGELATMAELGITAISVREQAVNETVDGQQVFARGSFSYGNGAQGDFVGVNLAGPDAAALVGVKGLEDGSW